MLEYMHILFTFIEIIIATSITLPNIEKATMKWFPSFFLLPSSDCPNLCNSCSFHSFFLSAFLSWLLWRFFPIVLKSDSKEKVQLRKIVKKLARLVDSNEIDRICNGKQKNLAKIISIVTYPKIEYIHYTILW